MASTIAAMVVLAALGAWHLRTRRHPGWHASPDARFFVCSGYGAIVIAVYWLTDASAATSWSWLFGNLWALGACASFVYGFEALDTARQRLQQRAQMLESLPGRDGRPARSTAG